MIYKSVKMGANIVPGDALGDAVGIENLQREGGVTHEESSAGHIGSNDRIGVGVVGEALLGAVDEISGLGAVCEYEVKEDRAGKIKKMEVEVKKSMSIRSTE